MTYFLNVCLDFILKINKSSGEKIKTYTYKNCDFKSFVSYKEHLFLIWEK